MRQYSQVFSKDAGIAIGPILFVIAIMGVLATAIASTSGGFTSTTAGDSARAKASAILEIGENLKVGFVRVTDSADTPFDNVIINAAHTSNSTDIYAPIGGGINLPSAAISAKPSTDVWHFPRGAVPYIGTGGSNTCQLAVINVLDTVCGEINNKILSNTNVESANVGDLEVDQVDVPEVASAWPTTLKGKAMGCLKNTNPTHGGYYFYQVMGVR